MSSILEELRNPGTFSQSCPITDKVPEGSKYKVIRTLPDYLKPILCLWDRRHKRSVELTKSIYPSSDGGAWFRLNNEADAIKYIIVEALRVEKKFSLRQRVEFYEDWKYSIEGL